MLHDPTAAAALRLAAEGLALHDAPFVPPPYVRSGGTCRAAAHPADLSTAKGKGTHNAKPSQRHSMLVFSDRWRRRELLIVVPILQELDLSSLALLGGEDSTNSPLTLNPHPKPADIAPVLQICQWRTAMT